MWIRPHKNRFFVVDCVYICGTKCSADSLASIQIQLIESNTKNLLDIQDGPVYFERQPTQYIFVEVKRVKHARPFICPCSGICRIRVYFGLSSPQ